MFHITTYSKATKISLMQGSMAFTCVNLTGGGRGVDEAVRISTKRDDQMPHPYIAIERRLLREGMASAHEDQQRLPCADTRPSSIIECALSSLT